MPLYQLIYISAAQHREAVDAEIASILTSSVRHNRENGITGMLLYNRGSFLQVLEGEEAALDETYGRIVRDERHHGLLVIDRSPIAARAFADWSMGFHRCDAADAATLPGFSDFLRNGFQPAELLRSPSQAKELLQEFARGAQGMRF